MRNADRERSMGLAETPRWTRQARQLSV